MKVDQSVICPVFIGRENDLQLLDHLRLQARDRKGQVALISGEAGIGKSRLVKETKARAAEGTLILEGHCFQTDSALPYAPLLDLFRNFLATRPAEEVIHAMVSSAPPLVKLLPELAVHLPPATVSPGPDPKQEKQRLFQALTQTLTGFARNQPLIVVIEDLHWSDSTSLEFLLLLARRIASQPILLLLTYRSQEAAPELIHLLAELDRERLGTEFALKRMSSLEAHAMLQAILGLNAPVTKEFSDTVFRLTEGNPFFIEEILKALVADGVWERKEVDQLRIPRTIQDAVQVRTQQLDEPTLQVLTLASVMGRRFDFRLLQELLEVNEEDLTAMLKRLVKAQLVVEETADQFAFQHALTREATYATLLLRERQRLHRLVGEAIERLYAASLDSCLADLSYHFYTSGVWQKAREYSQKAGEQARTLYAQREAIVYYSRALVAARELKIAVQPKLFNARGHAYEILGDFKSALEDFEQALKIAQEQQDGFAEWQTLIDIGFLWAGREYQKTGEYFLRAQELAQKLKETKLHAHSLNRLGNWSVNIGQTTQGLKSHRQALAIFEKEGDEQGMADTRDLLGMAAMQHGDQVTSYNEYRHAIQLFRKLDDKHGLVSALVGASNAFNWEEAVCAPSGPRAESQQMAREALELAGQIGWVAGQAFAEWGAAVGLANVGEFGEALVHAKEALRLATEIEHRQWITGAHYALGHAYVSMLQADLAIQNLEQGLTLARELGSAWWMGNIATDLANAYLLDGALDQAQTLLDSFLDEEADDQTIAKRRMLWAKGNLLLAKNKPDRARQIAGQLLASEAPLSEVQPIPALLKLRGEAWMGLKQWSKAEQDLELAKQSAEERQALPLLWQIHSRLGWLHKEQKDAEKSEREFADARQVLHKLAANIPEEQVRAAFIQHASETLPKEKKIPRRQSEAGKFGGLTPRERDVARCLAQGKSNREIAEELVLSERTVENHVGNILAKLGFDSRSQIAVWAVEKGLGKEKN